MEKPDKSLIVKFLKDQTTPSEQEAVQSWINSSYENQQEFEQLKKLWDSYDTKGSAFKPDMNAAWGEIERRLETKSEFKISPWFYRVAAMLIMGIGLVFMLKENGPETIAEKQQTPATRFFAQNEIKEVTLPDGSIITLNSEASIQYNSDFGKEDRRVQLEGEAFFEIERDEQRPFIISTKSTTTTVLGTSFSINPSEKDVTVSVVSGKVSFAGNTTKEVVLLTKGEKGNYSFSSNSISESANADLNFLAWKTGQLTFKDALFDDVSSDLEKHYKVTLEAKNKNIRRLTASFENQSIEEVLEIISSTLDVTIEKQADAHYYIH